MASIFTFQLSPYFPIDRGFKSRSQVQARHLAGEGSIALSSDSVQENGNPFAIEKQRNGSLVGTANGHLNPSVEESEKAMNVKVSKELEVLWDDGYGSATLKDYLDIAKDFTTSNGGPIRWFCPVECGSPLEDAPLLLFLPGIDGVGLGLILHHKALGKAFEVRCMHIPFYDRTPFEGLLKFVEEAVRNEHASSPNKPIYLVGDSVGGCLALAIAAHNPTIDLVLILVNPATSFGKSQLQTLLPLLEVLPDELHLTVPYLLSLTMGDPTKMAIVDIESGLPPSLMLEKLSGNLTALLPRLSLLSDIMPKEALQWKLKIFKSGAAYANSRLHAVQAEVLVLASGKDNMLPSADEAKRLCRTLKNCRVRFFKDNGHTLLLEDNISLLTVIKATTMYRKSKRHDFITDFLPPSLSEFKYAFDKVNRFLHLATSPVMFSTLENGKIDRGLAGVPSEGPVLLVGYHTLLGLELSMFIEGFLREKNILVRGVAHPLLFSQKIENSFTEISYNDLVRVFGALPVTASHFFKLFRQKSHVLLFPGGAREAFHRKGEAYKLFWPNQPEFVRMAARFGATIVPFGVVGEDDLLELVLDYDDIMNIPILNNYIKESNLAVRNVRQDMRGEIANQDLYLPGVLPKLPGRFYYLFGKPIETKGREVLLKDKENANDLYLQIKSEVEQSIAYLMKKRMEDPYRGFIDRTVYRAFNAPFDQVPAFDP